MINKIRISHKPHRLYGPVLNSGIR